MSRKRKHGARLGAAVLAAALAALAGTVYLRGTAEPASPEVTAPQETPSPTIIPSPTPEPTAEPTPSPTPSPEPETEYFVLSFVGDCTFSSTADIRDYSGSFESVVGDDLTYPFAATVQYFADDYLSIANLEGTFTTATLSSGALFAFKADSAYAGILPAGSIELVTLGNNHSGDYLEQGLSDTKDALDAVGVAYAENDGCYLYESGGGPKIGVYSKLFPTAAQVTAGVAALQEAGADIIIAALHWGDEGKYRPTADQQAIGHAAIDAGADIVYGSHPHVLQPVEAYGDGYIFYSLGNWSFGGNTAPRDRDTAIIQITVAREPDGTLSLSEATCIPCCVSGTDGVNDYQPCPYEAGTEDYDRAMSKLDGTFTGEDLTINYSYD